MTTDDDALVAAGMPAEQRLPALLALDTDGLPQAVIPGSLWRTARAAPDRADTVNGPASVWTVAIVVAAPVIRTALAELRRPGSARAPWAFATNARALTAAALSTAVLGLVGMPTYGYGAAAWALLAGALVALIVDKRPSGG
ncbi:hypothetical protein [Streptomyces wuyuanensis]|uniref:hypothetical protein n=1 Tax=Streptomyces wuyuanensis TaxID=1196353 RepID=UPI00341D6458